MRFSLETPATDAGWTVEQSRRNFDVVTKLVNTANPESQPAAAEAARVAGGRSRAYGRHVLDLARRIPSTRRS